MLRERIQVRRGQRLLDVPCGPGTLAHLFPSNGYIGGDNDPALVNYAAACMDDREFIVMDATKLGFTEASFDWVFVDGLFHHLTPDQAHAALDGFRRVLKPQGRVVILAGVPPSSRFNFLGRLMRSGDQGGHFRRTLEWKRLFGEYFKVVECSKLSIWPIEGCLLVLASLD
jgi:ubiquinone/menaquinone biosynthesis C-methylase UbiE